MAYSILDENGDCQRIRLIGWRGNSDEPVLMDWLPKYTDWMCDPCNHSSKRYEITWPTNGGAKSYYRWWEVVHHDDNEEEVKMKLNYAVRVRDARIAADKAQREWERLNG